ncbi:MAG: hypothetical protein ACOX40_07165 [Bacilli bacterium]|jgi:hypothetical protein|nr:hypothetical protein [Acholeplasmataceae bacterium]
MKKGLMFLLILSLLFPWGSKVNAQSNENKLEKMEIVYNELYNRLTLRWETPVLFETLTISYISTTGEFEYPIDFPNLPYPMQPSLDKNNRVQLIIKDPIGEFPYTEEGENPNFTYELRLFMDERLIGTTQFYFDYQLNGTQYENIYYVYNTGYKPHTANETTFTEHVFMGFVITILVSVGTYLIINASEKRIFIEEESEEE